MTPTKAKMTPKVSQSKSPPPWSSSSSESSSFPSFGCRAWPIARGDFLGGSSRFTDPVFAGPFAGFFLGGPFAGFLPPAVGDDRGRGASEEAEGASEERPNASRALESGVEPRDELGECCAHGPAAASLAKASCCNSSLGMAERPSNDDDEVSECFNVSTRFKYGLVSEARAVLTGEGCSAAGPLPVAGCA